jgi:cell division protein YceG involved in septum cleavage
LLFYVLRDTEGRHAFSTTYRLHEQNVATAQAAGILP